MAAADEQVPGSSFGSNHGAYAAVDGTMLPKQDPGGTPLREQHHRRVILLSAAHDGPELALVRFDPAEPEKAEREMLHMENASFTRKGT